MLRPGYHHYVRVCVEDAAFERGARREHVLRQHQSWKLESGTTGKCSPNHRPMLTGDVESKMLTEHRLRPSCTSSLRMSASFTGLSSVQYCKYVWKTPTVYQVVDCFHAGGRSLDPCCSPSCAIQARSSTNRFSAQSFIPQRRPVLRTPHRLERAGTLG